MVPLWNIACSRHGTQVLTLKDMLEHETEVHADETCIEMRKVWMQSQARERVEYTACSLIIEDVVAGRHVETETGYDRLDTLTACS